MTRAVAVQRLNALVTVSYPSVGIEVIIICSAAGSSCRADDDNINA
jgi:hypothetical protein